MEGSVYLPALLALLGLAEFELPRPEADRAGWAYVSEEEPVSGDALELPVAELRGRVLQVGRRGFARLGVAGGAGSAPAPPSCSARLRFVGQVRPERRLADERPLPFGVAA